MNKKKLVSIGLVLGLFLAAAIAGGNRFNDSDSADAESPLTQIASAARETPESTHQEEFQRLDINEDGMIDRSEANAVMALSKQFSDIAGSDSLSREEYLVWATGQPSAAAAQ